jgi:hypothetical protein
MCDKKNTIPRKQWHANRAMQHLQEGNGTDVDDNKNTEELTNDTADEELDDQQAYNRINLDEINDILAEPGRTNENVNPTDREEQQEEAPQQQNDQEDNAVTDNEDNETVVTGSSRPSRE